MDIHELYSNPWCLGGILVIPLLVMGMARMWKRVKDMKAAKAAGGAGSAPTTNE